MNWHVHRNRAATRLGISWLGVCAALVSGCGGGQSAGRAALPPQSQAALSTTQSSKTTPGNVTFSIGIKPRVEPARVTPKYISVSTHSLGILTDGANLISVGTFPSSPNCSPNPNAPGAYICTASINVPAGNHIFTITAYDSIAPAGNVLSTNTTGTIAVKAAGTTAVSVVLEGVVQHVALRLLTTNPPIGSVAAIGLTVVLEDADLNLIVGPAPFEHPVTLTTTDSTNGALTKTILTSPADTADLMANYTGAKVASITYSATALGLPAANVTDATLLPGSLIWRLYVTNHYSDTVTVFNLADPAAVPLWVGGGGLFYPNGAAIDANGMLYVVNDIAYGFGPGSPAVSVFDTAHGNIARPPVTGGALEDPQGVAIGADGKLYVTNFGFAHGSFVSVFDTAHGNAVLARITGGGLNAANGVAIGATGKLYVANQNGNSVSVFDTLHGNAALPQITGGGLDQPIGVAMGPTGELYVANEGSDSVSIFDTTHGNAVLPTITGGGLSSAGAVTLDTTGKLYVANRGGCGFCGDGQTVSVFDTSRGNAPLPLIFGGPNGVGLNGAFGVAIRGTLK